MAIDWVKRGGEPPPERKRIMIYSPDYTEISGMRYRFIDSEFFTKMTDATHWALPTPPLTEEPE